MTARKRTQKQSAQLFDDGAEPSAAVSAGDVFVNEPADVEATLGALGQLGVEASVVMLDPWYNKGVGGVRPDYDQFILRLLALSGRIAEHVFLWGFPEIVARFVPAIPEPLAMTAWLTWYYKNNPSVIRGWRSAQMTCLHLSRPGARMYPEHFLNEAQQKLMREGKLRYMPGPTSVIEASLLVGFVGRAEQTGHPSQKPVAAIEPLLKMTTRPGDLVVDPMCGSGTTGVVAQALGASALLSDISEEYVQVVERRLGVPRRPNALDVVAARWRTPALSNAA